MELQSIEALRELYIDERAKYKELASTIAQDLDLLVRSQGIRCDINFPSQRSVFIFKESTEREV